MSLIPEKEIPVFDLYFATLAGMNNHPGNTKEPVQRKPLKECAIQAIEMLDIRRIIVEGDSHESAK